MTQKIHKLCLVRGYKEAYYQLSEEEKGKLWDQVIKVVEKTGAKLKTPYYNCRWSNDKFETFWIMEYPNVEAAIKDTSGAEACELFRYMISETILGIEVYDGSHTKEKTGLINVDAGDRISVYAEKSGSLFIVTVRVNGYPTSLSVSDMDENIDMYACVYLNLQQS